MAEYLKMLVLKHSITAPSFVNFGKNARLVALFSPLIKRQNVLSF